jgi:hypothetical protein
MMEEAVASKILDLNKSEPMKVVWYPSVSVQSINLWKGFQFGHNRKHKHFCVLYAITGEIIWATESSCRVFMVIERGCHSDCQ